MEIKTRIGAIIIENNKILLLKGKDHNTFWTPGGKIESGETDEECLRRELKEELNVDITNLKFYKEYIAKAYSYKNAVMKNRIYLVSIKGKIKPSKEIELFKWFSVKESANKNIEIIPVIKNKVIHDIIKEDYLK